MSTPLIDYQRRAAEAAFAEAVYEAQTAIDRARAELDRMITDGGRGVTWAHVGDAQRLGHQIRIALGEEALE